jgi:hypothetical protein
MAYSPSWFPGGDRKRLGAWFRYKRLGARFREKKLSWALVSKKKKKAERLIPN